MKKHALVIGIDEYSDQNITRLRCAEQDAWRMKCLLGDCGFDVSSLIGRNATRHGINDAVDQLCAPLTAGDLFLFYFAGHGNDDSQGHHRLLTWGARRVDLDSGDEGDTIPVRSLERRTRGHGPMRLFILDACRAPLEHDRANRATALAPGTVRDLKSIVRDSGAAVPLTILSSCGPEQRAHEIVQLSAGVFTGAIEAVVAERRRDGLGLVLPGDLPALTTMTSALLLQYNIPGQQAPCCETTGHPVVLLAPRERAAPASTSRLAVLDVVSDPPGGQVLIDGGRWRGTAPFEVEEFPQGEHHYRATLENERISSAFQVNAYEVRLELDFPKTKAAREAKRQAVLGGLKEVPETTWAAIDFSVLAPGSSEAHERQAACAKELDVPVEVEGPFGMRFRLIPPGEFVMGSPDSEAERSDLEGPVHKVTITRPFWLGRFPVTQAQWQAVMGNNPSKISKAGADAPVENVSWDDCQAFLAKLNASIHDSSITDHRSPITDDRSAPPSTLHLPPSTIGAFRLPTEAEWEYACRAGTGTPFCYGDSLDATQANFDGNYPYGKGEKGQDRKTTTPVGSFRPDGFGLDDMHGNVWEWCDDWYDTYPKGDATDPTGPVIGSARVLRGGSWLNRAQYCRSANRYYFGPAFRFYDFGFRVVCSPRALL